MAHVVNTFVLMVIMDKTVLKFASVFMVGVTPRQELVLAMLVLQGCLALNLVR